MITLVYLLIGLLALCVIVYTLKKLGCNATDSERYLAETPIDPVTEDDGRCEDEGIKAAKEAAAAQEAEKAAEAQRILDEEAAAKAKVLEEAEAVRKAEEKAQKEAAEKETEEKAAAAEAHAKAEKENTPPKTEESNGVAPEGLLDAPRNGKKDNLTRIKGIGIKIDEALNGIGIYHFDQIAVWTEENMAWADSALSFPGRAKRDDWVGQAKLLADGKETAFSKRVDEGKVTSSKKA